MEYFSGKKKGPGQAPLRLSLSEEEYSKERVIE
jgi:hypothetical protein